jgi:hypothetical protein
MAQVTALNKENKNKRGKYSKWSKKTLKRRMQGQIELASKGFLPIHEYMRLKGIRTKNDNAATPTLEINNAVIPL